MQRLKRSIVGGWFAMTLLGIGGHVHADDRPAPSLALPSDAHQPYYEVALLYDVGGLVTSRIAVSLEVALAPHHSVSLRPQFDLEGAGLELEGSYHVWPMGKGLEGIWVGPAIGVRESEVGVRALIALDAGWQFAWDGWALSIGAGGALFDGLLQSPKLRAHLSIGYAWR